MNRAIPFLTHPRHVIQIRCNANLPSTPSCYRDSLSFIFAVRKG